MSKIMHGCLYSFLPSGYNLNLPSGGPTSWVNRLLFVSAFSIFGKKARINVTIHEKMIVSRSIKTTLFPRLFAKYAFMIKGNIATPNAVRIISNSGIPNPNMTSTSVYTLLFRQYYFMRLI
jgi:hypothetical protein